jgi:predicted TPR repeat methyltransferase
MKDRSVIRAHDDEAAQYDQQVKQYEYHIHDVLFGMCFEYINANERLLDMGIGTGLASLPFARAGLEIFGFDASAKMLKICEAKAFAKELKTLDLRDTPYPYSEGYFDHVISNGVFHFFGELSAIVKDVSRVMKPGGIFAFTVAAEMSVRDETMSKAPRNYSKIPTSWGEAIFVHSDAFITKVLRDSGFDKMKMQKVLIRGGDKDCDDLLFKVYVAKRVEIPSP